MENTSKLSVVHDLLKIGASLDNLNPDLIREALYEACEQTIKEQPKQRELIRKLESNKLLQNIAHYFNGDVILCGSALALDTPRDIDLRLVLSEKDFITFFGSADKWTKQGQTEDWQIERWAWARICALLSYLLSSELDLNIDFQIIPYSVVGVKIDFIEEPAVTCTVSATSIMQSNENKVYCPMCGYVEPVVEVVPDDYTTGPRYIKRYLCPKCGTELYKVMDDIVFYNKRFETVI